MSSFFRAPEAVAVPIPFTLKTSPTQSRRGTLHRLLYLKSPGGSEDIGGEDQGAGAILNIEALKDPFDVLRDRPGAGIENDADLDVRLALGDPVEDLGLAGGEAKLHKSGRPGRGVLLG